ncbi:2-hydroxyacylsphingosine 1-beta-galactosyltransferase-like isoform X2 [Erpetoichthys calabaricus]|uniref:2-hydroxyacylsphingosine 1-beta-galactosyltransferase-like isoform X2 n=1 Tax=Erpetoichthys calabaricus TaxID=27687 RepID=UPI002234C2BF|nr:2-hydroxyacylsphingosine 1-beta-galactosyltransferase-like isoform X2 [Erpetoichthys calabaricus]
MLIPFLCLAHPRVVRGYYMKVHILFVLVFTINFCSPAKILVIPPPLFESHLLIFGRIAEILKTREHEVVFLLHEGRETSISMSFKTQKYNGILSGPEWSDFLQEKLKRIFAGHMTSLELFTILERYIENCDMIAANQDLLSRLNAESFDLLVLDPNEMCGYIVANFLHVPYMVLSTGHWFPAEIGAPSPLAYVPEFNSQNSDRMGLTDRIWNVLVYVVSRIATHWFILPDYEAVMRKHDVNSTSQKSMMDLIRCTGLFLLTLDHSLDFSRPSLPNVKFVGGILTEPAKPLPEELHSWVEAAKDGVVVVSFGIGIQTLPKYLAEIMAAAFSRLPQRVIWRYSGDIPNSLGSNTRIMGWLPQNDLLGHPNVRVFVSHCGLNGVYEAIFQGVPVVGIPFYGDQYDIVTRVQAKGMGVKVDWRTLTAESFYQAIHTVIEDPSYKKTAMRMSLILQDHPLHPLNETVYWIEYLLRHGDAPHLRPVAYSLYDYQYYLLDVLSATALLTLLLVFLLKRCIVRISRKRHHKYQECPNAANRHFGNQENGHIMMNKKEK